MKISITKINNILCNINFLVSLIGYPLVTSIFLLGVTAAESSAIITVPYRGGALFLSLLVIVLNIRNKFRLNGGLFCLLLFWLIFVVRLFYDSFVRMDYIIDNDLLKKVWMISLLSCIIPMISIFVSYKNINLSIVFKWFIISINIVLLLSIMNVLMIPEFLIKNGRSDANIALDSIPFSHYGVYAIISSFFLLKSNIRFKNIYFTSSLILGFFSIAISGSRSPIVALFIIVSLFLYTKAKNKYLGLFTVFCFIFVLYIYSPEIIKFIGVFSPTLEYRLDQTINEHDLSGRSDIYSYSINEFLNSPIYGSRFAIFDGDGVISYSHNIFLDALMGTGIIGGIPFIVAIILVLKYAYSILRNNNLYVWISLLFLEKLIALMSSSAFYLEPLFSILMVFIFVGYNKKISIISYQSSNIAN